MQIIISDDAKSAITDIYDYSYNISSNYANRIVNKIYDTIYDLQDSPYSRILVEMFQNFQISSFEKESVKNIELSIIFLKWTIQFLYDTYFAEGKILNYFLKFMKTN